MSGEGVAAESRLVWDGGSAVSSAFEDPFLPKSEQGIFQPGFIDFERRQRKSIVFDLDESIAGMTMEAGYALRPGVLSAFDELSDQGWRLVLWTNQFKFFVRELFRDYPAVAKRFSRVIAGDDFLGTVLTYQLAGFAQ